MSYRILHISDLHVDEPGDQAIKIWTEALERVRADAPFDAVVVTGDLVFRATSGEYAVLQKWLDGYLLKDFVRGFSRERVVLLPGNHDVSWAHSPTDLATEPDRETAAKLLYAPHATRTRRVIDSRVVKWVEYDARTYHGRWKAFQEFYNRFYGLPKASGTAAYRFKLWDADPHWSGDDARHWALHVLDMDGNSPFAIACLNSAKFNDKSWRGASIDLGDVQHLMSVLRPLQNGPRPCKVLVAWHHGIDAYRGAVDFLQADDLERIRSIGARLGLHGHTHRHSILSTAKPWRRPTSDGGMFIVSAGSLGADRDELPTGTPRQFSVLTFLGASTEVTLYGRDHHDGSWERVDSVTLGGDAPSLGAWSRSRVTKCTIRVHVHGDGTSTHDVCLEDGLIDGELTLDVVRAEHGRVVGREYADWRGAQGTPAMEIRVSVEESPPGCFRYYVRSSPEIGNAFSRLEWRYVVSNRHALDTGELTHYHDAGDHIRAGGESEYYVPTFALGRLNLRVDFAGVGSASALVRFPVGPAAAGGPVWGVASAEPGEAVQCQPGEYAAASWGEPIRGAQYIVAFAIPSGSEFATRDERGRLVDIVRAARSGLPESEVRNRVIVEGIEAVLVKWAGGDMVDRHSFMWRIYGWAPDARPRGAFLPIWGRVPPRSWGLSYRYGMGLIAHAARFRRATGWTSETPREPPLDALAQFDSSAHSVRQEVLCVRRVDTFNQAAPPYGWNVAIPFSMHPFTRPFFVLNAVGAGPEHCPVRRALQELARNLVHPSTSETATARASALGAEFGLVVENAIGATQA